MPKMTTRTRRSLIAAAAIAATAVLSACGTAGPAPSGAAGKGTAGGASSVWVLSGATEVAFDKSFASWNDAHPSQKFTVQAFANDPYKQKIRTAVGADQAPTLIYGWGGGTLASYVDAGKVVDISDLVADPALKGRFIPSIAAVGQVDGKTYAVPNNGLKPVQLYLNKDAFTTAGVKPPKTWDDLISSIPKFKAKGIAPITVAGAAKWPLLMWEEYLVDRIGGPQVMKDIVAGKKDAWSDPAVIKANTMIQQLVDAGGFVNGFGSISTDSGADIALMYTGKAAMTLALPSAYQAVQSGDPGFLTSHKLGYADFPTVAGGKGDPKDVVGNPSNYWSVSASATKAQKKTAEEYIAKNLLNDSYVTDLLGTANVPPVRGIEPQLKKTSDPEFYNRIYKLADLAPSFQLSWDQALRPDQADALLTNLQQIFLKQITPKQFSAAMNKTL
ncbi:extracellular solute-binding protein [Pseudolysinimonas kribbensis]|uniref:extracellular solute-binding protein n=1 Tax=Pseudolysinimonas kribbensis TaxID=433641 RepID=UPI0024E13949|nr:extracellular solute-binding protein [Pseudolysinimonas kribbensis]